MIQGHIWYQFVSIFDENMFELRLRIVRSNVVCIVINYVVFICIMCHVYKMDHCLNVYVCFERHE